MWVLFMASVLIGSTAIAAGYDPLAIDKDAHPTWLDLSVQDVSRERTIPIRVYLSARTAPAPVVLFSHGLGGSRAGSPFLGEHCRRLLIGHCLATASLEIRIIIALFSRCPLPFGTRICATIRKPRPGLTETFRVLL